MGGIHRRCTGAVAQALDAYNYVNPANPVFSTKYGYGNLPDNRADLRPTGKRIIIDGTTSTVGNYFRVASLAAALAIAAGGDWILFPGGTSSAAASSWNLNGAIPSGPSTQNPTLFGTFDPAHNTQSVADEPYYNTKQYTLDATGIGSGNNIVSHFNSNISNVVFHHITFKAGLTDGTCSLQILGTNKHFWYWEHCIFDGTTLNAQNFSGNQSCTLTSVGLVATATLAVANALLQTGDTVVIDGANEAPYNGAKVITVVDATHFTYAFAGAASPATGAITYNPTFSRIPDSWLMNDWGFRWCGFMYGGSGTGVNNNGCMFLSGLRRPRFEAPIVFHGGYGRGLTRATPSANGGPNIFKHGFYFDDWVDDVSIMNPVDGWDSCNPKLTGGRFYVQNWVSVREPMSWIYASTTSNHFFNSFPLGSTMVSQNHLAIEAADVNTADAVFRGQGPQYTQAVAGSLYNGGLLVNQDNPNVGTRQGLQFSNGGLPAIDVRVTVNGTVYGSWVQDPDTTPDATTIVTFTNNVWENASSGSNLIVTDMPAAYQSRLIAATALNVHTTLRLAFPQWFSTVTVGATDEDTEINMLEFMCLNPNPRDVYIDPAVYDWATLHQYHVRSKLAGTT